MDTIVGTCMTKCPQEEIKWRQRERLIHLLEADEATVGGPAGRRRADPCRMIKCFQRSAAGRQLSDRHTLRPPPVLLHTADYILRRVLSRTEVGWPAVYGFCLDRLRAARQDLTVQQAGGPAALALLRRCAVFHLYADYRSRDCPSDVFDRHINTRQLQESLLGVLRLQALDGGGGDRELAERFEAVHLLFSLPHDQNMTAAWLRPHSRDLKLALDFRSSWESGNFVRASRLAREMSPLLQLAVYRHLPGLRRRGLRVLAAAYGSGSLAVPAAAVAAWLGYDDVSDLRCDVTQCGRLTPHGDLVLDRKLAGQQVTVPDRAWTPLERALSDPACLLAVCQVTDGPQDL